jgi:hypothetical protein
MTDIAKLERLLRMQLRALTEKSYAREQRFYGDPAKHIKFEREKNESRGSGRMAQAQKTAVVDTFHQQTPYDTCMAIWTEWMKLNDQQHSTGFSNPQDVKEFMAAGLAIDTMINDLKRHQWWAVRKARGICTVWNFPNVDLADALRQAEEALTPKMRQNVATRRYFIAAAK